MEEIWKDIDGFENIYQVSNMGRVRSLDRFVNCFNGWANVKRKTKGKILTITKQSQGYSQVGLCKNGTQKSYRLNRLVAKAFIPNLQEKPEVNHIDGNKDNNRVDNLEWVTNIENMQHAIKSGLIHPYKRRVARLNDKMVELEVYESLKEASVKNNISKSSICKSCKFGYKANGYYWKYKDQR